MHLLKTYRAPLAIAIVSGLIAFLCFGPARADTTLANVTAFPLPTTNQMFPARSNRLGLKCYNPPTNAAAIVSYASGYSFTLVPGASLWETVRPPQGKISATGTAGQILACEEYYQ